MEFSHFIQKGAIFPVIYQTPVYAFMITMNNKRHYNTIKMNDRFSLQYVSDEKALQRAHTFINFKYINKL